MNCLKSEDLELNVIDDTLDSLVIKSNGLEGEGRGLIDFKEFTKLELETTDFSELEPDTELIDFRDFSKPEPESMDFSKPKPESIDFSEPEPELELINFKDVSKPERKTDFSDPELECEYSFKPKVIENDMFLRICTKKPEPFIKEIGSKSKDKVGIFLFQNFSDSSAKLGRVQVAKYNLKMKTFCVCLAFITLYFSGIRATEFKQSINKR